MAQRAELFAKRFFLNDRTGPMFLVICGDNGCGKTHTARAIYRYCSAVAPTAWEAGYWKGGSTPASVFEGWSRLADTTDYHGRWLDIVGAQMAVLDDVGAEVDRFRSALPIENLGRMLGEREGRFTVVTTNVPPDQWILQWDARVEERLHRKSEIIELANVPSFYRKEQTKI
jgi:DNA replication protein DnaC